MSDIIAIPGGGSLPMPTDLEAIAETLTRDIARMNDTVRRAMEAGAVVEIQRKVRIHAGDGRWADQMASVVTFKRPA